MDGEPGRRRRAAGNPPSDSLSIRVHWTIVKAYCLRGAWCWFAARAVLSAVRWLGGFTVLHVTTATSVEIAVIAVAVSFLETGRRRERSLIGNLAVHPAALTMCFAIPALAGEAIVRIAVQV